jgi:hypothetical protein
MGYFKSDEIAGIRDDQGKIYCMECATAEQQDELTEEQIISTKEIEDPEEDFYFCDVCKKRLSA